MDEQQKAAISPISKYDDNCFQYVMLLALNHEEIRKNSERISKINLFSDKYNWEGIKYSSEKYD